MAVGAVISVAFNCKEKSSMESPSSAPVASASFQRSQNRPLFAMFKPVMIAVFTVRLAAAFPSLAPVLVVEGEIKSRLLLSVQVPVYKEVAFMLY